MRLFFGARDIIARLLICCATPVENISNQFGSMSSPSKSEQTCNTNTTGSNGESPLTKRQKKIGNGSSNSPHQDNGGEDDVSGATYYPFPTEDDLVFTTPADNSTFAQYLEKTKEVVQPLSDEGSIFFPFGIDETSFNLDKISMSSFPFAGVYCLLDKIGRATNCKTRYKDSTGGFVICALDKLPGTELDKIENSLRGCFEFLEEKHFENKFDEWLKGATIPDAQKMETDMGGISIFSCIYMHQALNNDGIEKFGVRKGLFLNHVETALQLFLDSHEGAAHEHLHCPSYLDWLVDNVNAIDKDLEIFQDKILQETGCKSLDELTFVHCGDNVTWEPGYERNSPEVLLRKLCEAFEGRDIPNNVEKIWSALELIDDDYGVVDTLRDVDDAELEGLKSVDGLVQLLFKKIGNFRAATEIAYDLLSRTFCSKDEYWRNMFKVQTERGKDQFNPESLGADAKREARQEHKNAIKEFKEKVDECKETNTVHWMRMDRMLSAYRNDNELKEIITGEFGMKQVHRYLETVVYAYVAENGLVGLLFLHHAFSKALSSLPPWDVTFSDEQIQDQGRAAIAFHWNQAIGYTFEGVDGHKKKFVSLKTLTGSFLPAYVLRMYIIFRIHHGDYRIATLFAKDLATTEQPCYVPLKQFSFKKIYKNKIAQIRHNNSLSYDDIHSPALQIMNKLSGPSNAPNFGARMEEAFYMVLGSEDPSEDRIGRRGGKVAYKDVLATVQKFLHKDGPVYKELEKKCFAEQNERKAKYEQEQEELRQERNRRAAEEAQQFQNVQGASTNGTHMDENFFGNIFSK